MVTVESREETRSILVNLRKPKTRGKVVKRNETCDRDIGIICDKNSCTNCYNIFKGKEVIRIKNSLTGDGLAENEDICTGDYICKYTGVWLKNKPDVTGDYLASVRMQSGEGRKEVKYIDGVKSKSKAKYCNHSCDFNAVFFEVITKGVRNPTLWIKAVKDIKDGEEVFLDYGQDMLNYIIEERGGCKCHKCYNGGL